MINRALVPVELQDGLLGSSESFLTLPTLPEPTIEFPPISKHGLFGRKDWVEYLTQDVFGDEFPSGYLAKAKPAPTTSRKPVKPVSAPCTVCACFACMTGVCSECELGTDHPPEAAPPASGPIVPSVQSMEQIALANARKFGTLTGDQLAALEVHVEGSTDMRKHVGKLCVRRIVPPSQEDNRYRVEFDGIQQVLRG